MSNSLPEGGSGPRYVDTTATPSERKRVMRLVIERVVSDVDSAATANYRETVKSFLLHVSWHEGWDLTKRRQYPTGPGRSFFQFEAPRAKDAIEQAKGKGWLWKLAAAAGKTEQEIQQGGDAITSSSWPTTNTLIESLLASDTNDVFSVYMARIVLTRYGASIPEGIDAQAQYWAKYWKVSGCTAEHIEQFKQNAREVDAL